MAAPLSRYALRARDALVLEHLSMLMPLPQLQPAASSRWSSEKI
jgi:hypothetical protein